ncbi:TPA: gp53-like domain-containing protein [Citrobacter braakii]
MALSLLAANNAQTVLAAGISSTATSLTVNAGTGTLFPSPVAGTSFFKLTIIDAATGSLTEIVHVTAWAGDVFTIQRAQEGTTARAWSANDIAANMLTAGSLQLYAQKDQSLLIDNNLSEIANAGPAAVAKALANLGLSNLVLAGVGAGSLGTTGYAEIPLVISGEKKMLLLCWGIGSTGSNGSFTQSFAKAFPTAVLCKLVTNEASRAPSGFAGASTTLSKISIYSASATETPSGSGVAYSYLTIGY